MVTAWARAVTGSAEAGFEREVSGWKQEEVIYWIRGMTEGGVKGDTMIHRLGRMVQEEDSTCGHGAEDAGGRHWQIGTEVPAESCIKRTASGNLPYRRGRSAPALWGPRGAGGAKRDGLHVCMWLARFLAQQKPAQHCNATPPPLKS